MTNDEKLRELEKWLTDLYAEAEKELRKKWDAYLEKQEKKGAELQAQIAAATTPEERKKAEEQYQQFLVSKTAGSKWYSDMIDETARQYAEVNQRALALVNGDMSSFYANGYNLSADEINAVAIDQNIGIRFDLCSPEAVDWLAEHREEINLPPPKVLNIPEDERWNAKLLNSQVTQGIVQGESIPKIAARIGNVTNANLVSSVRAARTMATACENAGRVQAMKTAEQWGVQTRKQWISQHDRRTRDSHNYPPPVGVSDVIVANDEVFPNGCRYPGDPAGPPEEVYCCRCTLITVVDGFSSNLPRGKENAVTIEIDGEIVH